MQKIADVSKIAKTVKRNLTFILNVFSEPSIHFTQLSLRNVYNFLIQLLLLKSSVFVVYFSNAFWDGNEAFPEVSSQNEIVPLFVIFHLPYSKYRGVKICFYSCRYQNQNFSLVSHSCRSCSTRVVLVSDSCCSCRTRVTPMSLVFHSCRLRRSCLTLVL